MGRYFRSNHENLTIDARDAESNWNNVEHFIEYAGRKDILENPTILDIGGGTAELSAYLNQRGGWKCVSIDNDGTLTKKEGAMQVRGDAKKLPFADASFEIVYEKGMFDANIYDMNWTKIIPEIHRVLKPRGLLCIVGADSPPNEELEPLFTRLNPQNSLPIWEKK